MPTASFSGITMDLPLSAQEGVQARRSPEGILTIGSDPEGVWLDRYTGRITNFRTISENSDAHVRNFANSPIGIDGPSGSSAVAEFRPRYADNPLDHFEEISTLIEASYLNYHKLIGGRYLLLAGCESYPTGGHIHFGGMQWSETLIKKCVSNLDYWLAPLILPFFNQVMVGRRMRDGYGQLNDWRNQNHGFEYRTLPSWLGDPIITKGVLCLAYLIVKATCSGKIVDRIKKKDEKWLHAVFERRDYQELLALRQESIPKLLEQIQGESYARHIKKMIVRLSEPVGTLDVFDNWGKSVLPVTLGAVKSHIDQTVNLSDFIIENLRVRNNLLDFTLEPNFGPWLVRRPFTRHSAILERLLKIRAEKKLPVHLSTKYADYLQGAERITAINTDPNLKISLKGVKIHRHEIYLLTHVEIVRHLFNSGDSNKMQTTVRMIVEYLVVENEYSASQWPVEMNMFEALNIILKDRTAEEIALLMVQRQVIQNDVRHNPYRPDSDRATQDRPELAEGAPTPRARRARLAGPDETLEQQLRHATENVYLGNATTPPQQWTTALNQPGQPSPQMTARVNIPAPQSMTSPHGPGQEPMTVRRDPFGGGLSFEFGTIPGEERANFLGELLDQGSINAREHVQLMQGIADHSLNQATERFNRSSAF